MHASLSKPCLKRHQDLDVDGLERAIAARLISLFLSPLCWNSCNSFIELEQLEQQLLLSFSQSQRAALHFIFCHKIALVSGGPGTGKTTLARAVVSHFISKGLNVALCAPTGRGAKRLTELARAPAVTIHRLLSARCGGFERNAVRPIDADYVIVDEMSMVDLELMHALLESIPSHCGLLLIGDAAQLPSVGPGRVWESLLGAGVIPALQLREPFRHRELGGIARCATAIRQGIVPEFTGSREGFSECLFEECDLSTLGDHLAWWIRVGVPRHFQSEVSPSVQVLVPVNGGAWGVRQLNDMLRQLLNPQQDSAIFAPFCVGDRVMVLRNYYQKEVFNGDVGMVVSAERAWGSNAVWRVVVAFGEREIVFAEDECDDLILAWATTTHKAQGSEFDVVIIPVLPLHGHALHRSLIYTALTRARKFAIFLGDRTTFSRSVQESPAESVVSNLAFRLRDGFLGGKTAENTL